jgi:hypothetical protein
VEEARAKQAMIDNMNADLQADEDALLMQQLEDATRPIVPR